MAHLKLYRTLMRSFMPSPFLVPRFPRFHTPPNPSPPPPASSRAARYFVLRRRVNRGESSFEALTEAERREMTSVLAMWRTAADLGQPQAMYASTESSKGHAMGAVQTFDP